jgi:hypothetical protein
MSGIKGYLCIAISTLYVIAADVSVSAHGWDDSSHTFYMVIGGIWMLIGALYLNLSKD